MTSALPFGYNVSDADRLAHSAAWAVPGVLPYRERHDAGRHAVIEALYEAEEDPGRPALYYAAVHAIDKARHRELSANGYSTVTHRTMRNHAAFWAGIRRPPDWLEESVIEPIALRQILAVLPSYQRLALRVLADAEDYDVAAETLGITRHTLKTEIYHARKTFKKHWYAPDLPPRRYSGWATTRGHANRRTAA